jgi:hypothetical protein
MEVIQKPEVVEDDLNMIKMFMTNGKYKTIIHLPKTVKSITGKNQISPNDSTVIFEYDLLDFMLGNVNTSYEISMDK